ncbi:tetratricopeptide repeat protein [Dysgonomonas sp. 216]|uniref:tetratricopeptide repeat protein n=1 Tax=Dysgonomonas sp. 216 TaxID=2302934 RepID=UPI0013D69F51|nr:tetratricopeptide repeat protein [Dysgonomonas sp. 216]NDW18426.1 tetratricopeptide repeat protein [Dysgonomonas sp. 216]
MIAAINIWGLIAIFGVILLAFSAMIFYIQKTRRKSKHSLASFSHSVKEMLDKIDSDEGKLRALEQLIKRIEGDAAYQKTPDWKKSVLAKVYEHQAYIYYTMNNDKGVVKACTKVIENDPSHGMSYYNRGSIYNNEGKYDKALKDFNDAILLMPDYASAYNNRGLVFDKMGKYDDALADFDHALSLSPSAVIYFNRANLYYEQKKFEEAKSDYRQVLMFEVSEDAELMRLSKAAIELIEQQKSNI